MFRIIAGSARADGLKGGATRALLLASTALTTGIFAGAMVNPQTAQAQQVRCSTFTSRVTQKAPRTFAWGDTAFSSNAATSVICDTMTTTSTFTTAPPLFAPSGA